MFLVALGIGKKEGEIQFSSFDLLNSKLMRLHCKTVFVPKTFHRFTAKKKYQLRGDYREKLKYDTKY
jgi:hypothetical protein